MEKGIELAPWDEFYEDCKMTLQEFIECVEMGAFIDYDGYGVYATDEGVTHIEVYPSSVLRGWVRDEFPYVCWFNR